jgi:hypothetical protein
VETDKLVPGPTTAPGQGKRRTESSAVSIPTKSVAKLDSRVILPTAQLPEDQSREGCAAPPPQPLIMVAALPRPRVEVAAGRALDLSWAVRVLRRGQALRVGGKKLGVGAKLVVQ